MAEACLETGNIIHGKADLVNRLKINYIEDRADLGPCPEIVFQEFANCDFFIPYPTQGDLFAINHYVFLNQEKVLSSTA